MTLYTNYLIRQIQHQATTQPNNIAIETDDKNKITWQELQERVENLALNLVELDFKKGTRVFFFVKHSIEAVITLLGVIRAGGVLITADPGMGADNLRSRVDLSQPEWAFCESVVLCMQQFSLLRLLAKQRGVEIPEMQQILARTKIVRVGRWLPGLASNYNFDDLIKPNQASFDEVFVSEDDFQITFTSGTLGLPKAVVHTHHSTDQTIKIISQALESSPADTFYTNQYYIVFPALVSGSKVILNTQTKFRPKQFLHQLAKYKVTHLFEIPTKLQLLIDFCKNQGIIIPLTLKTIITGSAPTTKSFLSNLQNIMPAQTKVWSVYGMTEILPISLIEMKDKLAYHGSGDILGKPLTGIKLRLENDGELVVSGSNLCDRFLNDSHQTEIHTGDICRLYHGNLILLSRKKDMIIKSHYNIYPNLFEQTIENIEGVKHCAILGSFDNRLQDEKVILVVVKDSKLGDQAFIKYLSNKLRTGPNSIDQYAFPDKIILVKELPVSGKNQKVDKRLLRQSLQLDKIE